MIIRSRLMLCMLLLLSLLSITTITSAQEPPSVSKMATKDNADTLKKAALKAMQAKNWTLALGIWDRYIALSASSGYGHRMRGSSLRELERMDEAITAYQKSIELEPQDSNGWHGLCWTLIVANKAKEARGSCAKAVELEPNNYAALVNFGHTYLLQGDTATAYEWYKKALLNIDQEQQLKEGPLGDFDLFITKGWQVKASQDAKAWFETEGLTNWRSMQQLVGEIRMEAMTKNYAQMLSLIEKELSLLIFFLGENNTQVKDVRSHAILARNQYANSLYSKGEYAQAITHYQHVLASNEKYLGPEDKATTLSLENVAKSLEKLKRHQEAEPLYVRALTTSEKVNGPNHSTTSNLLNSLASLYEILERYEEAERLYVRALAISEKVNGSNHPTTIAQLNSLASLFMTLERNQEAEPLLVRAVNISEGINGGNHLQTGLYLKNLALIYEETGRYAEALPLYTRALAISEQGNGRESITTAIRLRNLADLYQNMARYADALPLLLRALSISEKKDDLNHGEVARCLNSLGTLHHKLGLYAEAESLLLRALAMSEKAYKPTHRLIGIVQNNLAALYNWTKRPKEALILFQHALANSEKKNGLYSRTTYAYLNNLASLYCDIKNYDEASNLFLRAIEIAEKIYGTDHPYTSASLHNLASLYVDMGRIKEAELLYRRSWRISGNAGWAELEWNVQGSLREFFSKTNPDLAIWYGKQTINTLQRVRAGNSGLEKETQKSFLQKYESSYKSLADLLFARGRLAEGQQVLAMLKESEYFDFLQRSSASDPRKTRADFTDQERPWTERYSVIEKQLASLGKEAETLREKSKKVELSAEELKRKEQLDADLIVARQAFDAFAVDLKKEFTQNQTSNRSEKDRIESYGAKNLAGLTKLQGTLRELTQASKAGVVSLHYLMTEQRLWILLTTPTVQLKREVGIKEADLNRQIGEYRAAIAERNPKIKELGKALYDVILAPVIDDLKQADAKTLMVSLDGSLRYLPIAALYDGKSYVAERYHLSLLTSADYQDFKDAPRSQWTFAGYGLTQKIEDFNPLPAVQSELEGMKRDMKGQVKLNNDFTSKALKAGLEKEPPVVHVASHFVFKPGNQSDSFLLLGDGKRLSLKDINEQYQFINLDLLTLSACETAVGGGKDENGREVEGFAMLAQQKGAKSVLATLWNVNDESTGQFMQLFYGYRQKNPGMSKAQAIQMAQQAFIEGKVKPSLAQVRRAAESVDSDGKVIGAAVTSTDHPYYWAPFILMGNWR